MSKDFIARFRTELEYAPGTSVTIESTLDGVFTDEFDGIRDATADRHPPHLAKTTKMGRAVRPGEFMHVVGNFTGVDHARDVMGMPWANRDGLREAIPPIYAEHVGEHLRARMIDLRRGALVLTSPSKGTED